MELIHVYNVLLKSHGSQNWWPSKTGSKFEICIGAILTQNTSWNNVDRALNNLIKAKAMNAKRISKMNTRTLQSIIKPSGFFRQKALRLKGFSNFVLGFGSVKKFLNNVTREQLLDINGIGPETADSMLLYACGKPYFVVDAYTKRIFSALGMLNGHDYEETRELFEHGLPKDVQLYKEYHALIVRHSKECCRGFTKDGCILRSLVTGRLT